MIQYLLFEFPVKPKLDHQSTLITKFNLVPEFFLSEHGLNLCFFVTRLLEVTRIRSAAASSIWFQWQRTSWMMQTTGWATTWRTRLRSMTTITALTRTSPRPRASKWWRAHPGKELAMKLSRHWVDPQEGAPLSLPLSGDQGVRNRVQTKLNEFV